MLKQETQLEPVVRQTIAAGAIDRIRRAILAGSYPPGEQLVERQLATQLGVSTIAVREAFVRLVEEGLIVRRPHKGAFVARFDVETLVDVSRVRVAIEVLAVELAIAAWTTDAEAAARRLLDEMATAARAGDAERLVDLDTAFHEHFWRMAGSEALLDVATRLRGRVVRMVREAMILMQPADLIDVWRVHDEWLAAVASRDVPLAQAVARAHVEHSVEKLSPHLALREPPSTAHG